MYKSPYLLADMSPNDVFTDEIFLVPNTRVEIVATEQWARDNAGRSYDVAQEIIAAYRPMLNAFVGSQRQNRQLGIASNMFSAREAPGIGMHWGNIAGQEMLRVSLFPETFGRQQKTVTDKLEIPIHPTIEVNVPFTYWPIPGSQAFGNPAPWERLTFSVNFYDPVFAPGRITDAPALAEEPPALAAGASGDGTPNGTVDMATHEWDGDPPDQTPSANAGYLEDAWLENKVGGSAIFNTMLEGKMYFEVELKSLPVAVPESETKPVAPGTVDYGEFQDGPLYYYDQAQGSIRKWPEGLNTFLSPSVGIAPKYFKTAWRDPEADPPEPGDEPDANKPGDQYGGWAFTPVVLNLDPRIDKPRSIAAVRTSVTEGPATRGVFRRGYYAVRNTSGSDFTISAGGFDPLNLPANTSTKISELHPLLDRVDGEPIPGRQPWEGGTYQGVGDELYRYTHATEGLDYDPLDDFYGPLEGDGVPQTDPVPGSTTTLRTTSVGGLVQRQTNDYRVSVSYPPPNEDQGMSYRHVGFVGGPLYTTGFFTGSPGSPIANTLIERVEHSVEFFDDGMEMVGDFVTLDPDDPESRIVIVPSGVGVGRYMPIIKGRIDYLDAGSPPPDSNAGAGSASANYIDDPKDGDIIMVAVDVDNKRVWFGKNGVWAVPEGTEADFKTGDGAAARLDVEDGKDNPEYYPCMSWRVGPTRMIMHLGASCTYALPPGFVYVSESLKFSIDIAQRTVDE